MSVNSRDSANCPQSSLHSFGNKSTRVTVVPERHILSRIHKPCPAQSTESILNAALGFGYWADTFFPKKSGERDGRLGH